MSRDRINEGNNGYFRCLFARLFAPRYFGGKHSDICKYLPTADMALLLPVSRSVIMKGEMYDG